MTIEHYLVKKKYPAIGKTMDESWIKDVADIIEKIDTDKEWMKKVDAIIREIHGEPIGKSIDYNLEEEVKIDEEAEFAKYCDETNVEEYYDDHEWYRDQQEESDRYNNRGTVDGIISHCDLDDIDDGWR